MRILVTGATGFLGRHLLKHLTTHPDFAGAGVLALARRAVDLEADVRLGDVLRPDTLRDAMAGCEVVVHAAGEVSHHPEDALRMWEIHVRGTENVLDAARAAGVRRVVHLSTSGTLGISRDPEAVATEDTPAPMDILQQWSYYRAKCYSEQSALAAEGIEVVCLNPSLLLGPGDTRGTSTRPVRYFLARRVPAVPPGGLSFVDVRDVADAVGRAILRGKPRRRYLLGGANMSFHEFYSRLARITGLKAPVKLPSFSRKLLDWMPGVTLPGFDDPEERIDIEMACYGWYIRSDRARDELGWVPRDAGVTLQDTVDSVGTGLVRG